MICPDCGDLGALRLHRVLLEGGLTPLGWEHEIRAREEAAALGGVAVPAVFCVVEGRWVG